MTIYRNILLVTVLFLLSACGAESTSNDNLSIISSPDTDSGTEPDTDPGDSTLISTDDEDNDGILNADDLWPYDDTKPQVSRLWGSYGENWTTDSRLPFFAFAGYRDGSEPPTPTEVPCSIDISDARFGGAVADDGIDDTEAFWAAISEAKLTATATDLVAICIPEGQFDLSKQIQLDQAGLILRGAGQNKTLLNYKKGMLNQNYEEFIGAGVEKGQSAWSDNRTIIIGTKGHAWNGSIKLLNNSSPDLSRMPKYGDMTLPLLNAIGGENLINLEHGNYRMRLLHKTSYRVNSTMPTFTAGIFGGPPAQNRVASQVASAQLDGYNQEITVSKWANNGLIKTANGGETIYQEFNVTYQGGKTLTLDRPLRFSPTEENRVSMRLQVLDRHAVVHENIGFENLTLQFAATPWGSCDAPVVDHACNTSTAGHSGYYAQGGISIVADNSWLRNITIINSDNPIEIKGQHNSVKNIVIKGARPTKANGYYGHAGISLRGHDNLVDDVAMDVPYIHTLSMANAQGSVFSNIRAIDANMGINLDHHRQTIYATLWTDIELGDSKRMWDSTGGITEGFNAAAYNTYWGLFSLTPSDDTWPNNRTGSVEWGYHYINIVGTNIAEKPPIPQELTISEMPYPYVNKNPEQNPFPYHPDNAHLEAMAPELLWPANLYHAQRDAYLNCMLAIKPDSCMGQ